MIPYQGNRNNSRRAQAWSHQFHGIFQISHLNPQVFASILLELQKKVNKRLVYFQHHHGFDWRAPFIWANGLRSYLWLRSRSQYC